MISHKIGALRRHSQHTQIFHISPALLATEWHSLSLHDEQPTAAYIKQQGDSTVTLCKETGRHLPPPFIWSWEGSTQPQSLLCNPTVTDTRGKETLDIHAYFARWTYTTPFQPKDPRPIPAKGTKTQQMQGVLIKRCREHQEQASLTGEIICFQKLHSIDGNHRKGMKISLCTWEVHAPVLSTNYIPVTEGNTWSHHKPYPASEQTSSPCNNQNYTREIISASPQPNYFVSYVPIIIVICFVSST